MKRKILQPSREKFEFKGNISYSENLRAWCIIRLRRELINEFPALKERRSKLGYHLTFYRDYDKLERAIRKMKMNNMPLPLLMFMEKRSDNFKKIYK